MRKICLSRCFKRKMSKTRENIWNISIGMFFGTIGIIVLMLVIGGTGYLLGLVFPIIEQKDWFGAGISFYIALGILWWFGWLLFKVYKKVTSAAFKIVREKYENDMNYENCSIFEYCDVEPGEENEKNIKSDLP